jgi:hypothetical protein
MPMPPLSSPLPALSTAHMEAPWFFLLTCYGLTFFVMRSSLLARPRDWLMFHSSMLERMLSCAFCTGTWVSLVAAGWVFRIVPRGRTLGSLSWAEIAQVVAHLFLTAMAGAAAAFLLDAVAVRLQGGGGGGGGGSGGDAIFVGDVAAADASRGAADDTPDSPSGLFGPIIR